MRHRMLWLIGFIVLGLGSFAAFSLTRGQPPQGTIPQRSPDASPAEKAVSPKLGPTVETPRTVNPQPAGEKPHTGRSPSKLTPLQQQMYWSAQRGADWLYRMNGRDGRFVPGYVTALRSMLEGDHYLRQAGAAFALARAARFTGEERFAVRATQALLLLLKDTATDPKDPQVCYTSLPAAMVNRLAAAGLLVSAINELPSPPKDLLDQSEQLCNFMRKQQQADGSLCYAETPNDKNPVDPDGINHFPGPALYGLMRSQQHRPAAWKIDVVRKALAYYQPWWRAHKNLDFVGWQTAAYSEAYLATKEQRFADFVFEMNDWLCGLQYDRLDRRHPLWYGGFQSCVDGKPAEAAPRITSAAYAESLAEACRLAREMGDASHFNRYKETLERSLQFLATLQYTNANTEHFADWYQRDLLGGFFASHQDGNLRIDYTQHAVSALVLYLTYVVRDTAALPADPRR